MSEAFMKEALKEAKKALKYDEVPIGAVIVKDGKIIARGYNKMEKDNSPTSHAEIIAINKACKKLSNWRLSGCEMYVTLEPCIMCYGAILNSRIDKLYVGALDDKVGTTKLFKDKIDVDYSYLSDECEQILKDFFKDVRKSKGKA